MASKIGGLLKSTENGDLDEGNIRPVGVGLTVGEVKALDEIAGELGIARNALLRYAVRDFIKRCRSGEVNLADKVKDPPAPKKKLNMD
jgi:hypothetical protein